MPNPYADCAQKVSRLHAAVVELERACQSLQLKPLAGRDWFELLTKKLLPQLGDEAFLVVAVVGGTNIGKSVVFNHIAGCRASATSPLASGTKHPVCLVPPGFSEQHDLAAIFSGFELHECTRSELALEEASEDRLYWQVSDEMPDNLLVLDTPDIDSDAVVNWHRADNVRRSADVLIAVLTQQKYNDAVVKQFFRKAAQEDKAVLVVFNQCQLPDDEEYWPLWLATFCDETGIAPEFVYVAPNDRSAAEENRLPFYERHWRPDEPSSESSASATEGSATGESEGRSLSSDLSELRFGEIKVRTLRGSLNQLLDPNLGLPAYLAEIERRSDEFRSAAELLSTHRLAEIDNWPTIPNHLLVAEIRNWWQTQREGWTKKVHGFYNAVGSGLIWPFRYAEDKIFGKPSPPLELYHKQEWDTVLDTVEKVYEKLQWFAELGNKLLRPRLDGLLAGTSRSELLKRFQAAHAACDLEAELEELVVTEMQSFRQESPQFYTFLKRLDSVAAAARPATSTILFITGFGPAGNAAAQLATDTALQSVVQVAGDLAGGTVAAAVGETAISSTTASGVGYLEAKFRKLHASFTARRAGWLAGLLKDHLLGSLPEDLQAAACIRESADFHEVQEALDSLSEQFTIELREAIV